jgi:hypothetical protein
MRTRAKINLAALALLVAGPAWGVGACGGSKPPPDTATAATGSADTSSSSASSSSADTSTSAPADTSSASPSASASAEPVGIVLFKDSDQIQKLYDAAANAPQATLDSKPKPSDPLVKGVTGLAAKYAKDMTPDGPLIRGKLAEKQHLQTDITLQPGKCYKLIGFATPKKVKDFDLQLFVGGILSAQDTTDDNTPVVNQDNPMCPSGDNSTTYKLDLFVEKGAGDVAVQLYSKAK